VPHQKYPPVSGKMFLFTQEADGETSTVAFYG
jgi:hypothetical protein